jgi:hypothetical protein
MKYQILRGAYTATLYVSGGSQPTIHHAIITKHGSSEIISWVQCDNAEDCEREALECLADLNGAGGSNLLLFPPVEPKALRKLANRKKKKRQAAV